MQARARARSGGAPAIEKGAPPISTPGSGAGTRDTRANDGGGRDIRDAAHARGLAIAPKSSTELVARRDELATKFVVAEECSRSGDHVLVIEYRRADFDAGCAAFPGLSIVLRDLDLVPAGAAGYVTP